MPDWRESLTPEERERLAEIAGLKRALAAEQRKLWDRARKRMAKDA